jgi:hypothetical protein
MLSLAHCVLLAGELRRGWPLNELRLNRESARGWPGLPPHIPKWDGTRLERGLMLVAEQGFGDTVQFVRYGRLLNEQGMRPVLQCHRRLVRLLSTTGFFEAVVPFGTVPSGVRSWFPLLSLPLPFGTELSNIPATVPYIHAEPELVGLWKKRLGGPGVFRIGIAWQGNPLSETGHLRDRSVPLEAMQPLFSIPGVEFHCMQ